jgi:hypothetical protein
MTRKLNLKKLAAAAVGAFVLALTPAAFATTGSDSNGVFAVSSTLTCASCEGDSAAVAGDDVILVGTVSNLTNRYRKTAVSATLYGPAGGVIRSASRIVTLAPHEDAARSDAITVPERARAGTYTLVITADGVSAKSTIEVASAEADTTEVAAA